MMGGRTPDGRGEGRQRFSGSPSWRTPLSVNPIRLVELKCRSTVIA